MEVFQGIAAFPGIAIGTIQNYHKNEYQIRHYTVSSSRRNWNVLQEQEKKL